MNDYESYIARGIAIREAKDNTHWQLGDLALELIATFGEDKQLEKDFANAINLDPTSFSQYKRVAALYPRKERSSRPNLSWTHYRIAAYVTGFDPSAASALLDRASAEGMTTRQLQREAAARLYEWEEMTLADVLARYGAKTPAKVRALDGVITVRLFSR